MSAFIFMLLNVSDYWCIVAESICEYDEETNVYARRRYVDIKVTLDFVNDILRFPYIML
jgi:hypothetical protein